MAAQLTVYADATALIALSRIDRLDLLAFLPTPVRVTDLVWQEVAVNPGKPGVAALWQARRQGLIVVVEEGDATYGDLDPGESSVLSAAAQSRAVVLIDERKARSLIDSDLRLKEAIGGRIGTVGLILLAKRRGYVVAVRPLLDDLIRQKFWLSAALYEDVLREAGEE